MSERFRLRRRELLRAGMAASALLAMPRVTFADDEPASSGKRRTLVSIHLVGGNDGLNTVVPYADPLYRVLRPSLALDPGGLHRLSDELALHPALAGLAAQWRKEQLAVIGGVGYPEPSFSHFRATEIWQTAEPERSPTHGWLGRALEADPSGKPLRAVSLTKELPLSLRTQAPGAVNMTDFSRFRVPEQARGVADLYRRYESMPGIRAEVGRSATQALDVARRISRLKPAPGNYSGTLGRSLRMALSLLQADLGLETVQIEFGGFDTHAGQLGTQQALLTQLGNNLNVFQTALEAAGIAESVVTLVFSEFGRRVTENASGGTDHGSAGPVFVLGKGIRGGLHGEQPSLEDLDNGNLSFTTDFRSIYAAILTGAFRIDPAKVLAGEHPALELFA